MKAALAAGVIAGVLTGLILLGLWVWASRHGYLQGAATCPARQECHT